MRDCTMACRGQFFIWNDQYFMYKKLSIQIESKYEYVTVWGKVRRDWKDTESYKENDWMGGWGLIIL